MTTQLLATELANLIQESKRKNTDLRQAAEKSLEELKTLRGTTEAQIAAELSQKINFVNPLIVACGTKNAKFTGIAIVCLLRLIVISALPRSKLNSILEALREATSAGVDAQLKVLQALPTLLQNYSADIKGDLLVTALNICFILQTSKNGIINNTSAATLQQLLVSVFDKVATEDKSASDDQFVGDAPTQDGGVNLRSAAMDAYRVFRDICLLTENQRAEYIRFTGLPQTFGLELIESVLTSHAAIFSTHPEQAHIIRINVLPLIIAAFTGKPKFAVSVRVARILYTLLKWHLDILGSEGAEALDILAQVLDQDTAVWKRALCMEVFRGIFAEPALLRRIFSHYDAKEGEKKVLQRITATFVRVSTERPQVIGLGNQSTIPAANPYGNEGSSDQVMLEASGVTGIISGSVGNDTHNVGISSQWSMVRVPCIDQLDKAEPPPVPDSYIYALTLSCITSLSEGLAKFILPLTVPGESRSRRRNAKHEKADSIGKGSPARTSHAETPDLKPIERVDTNDNTQERSGSFKRNPVPVNPLTLQDHPLRADIQTCADIIDECWPAILATCSTFLFSSLDSEFYHGLVRAFQKFAHVSGLLQLSTPRDAFLTTLGKAAVPPNVFSACLSSRGTPATPVSETPTTLLSNARGLLSVDSLVTPVGAAGERQRQASVDASATPQTINTRNLLCLRALINLGIALGPTLSKSWTIVLETLQQADFVLFATGKSPGRVPIAHAKNPDPRAESEATSLLGNFKAETRSVETAASRLFESTVDFPNDAFVEVVAAVCGLLVRDVEAKSAAGSRPVSPAEPKMLAPALRTPSGQHRKISFASAPPTSGPTQEDQFALAKLGDLAVINVDRLLSYPPDVSGWNKMVIELTCTLTAVGVAPVIRMRAAEILIRVVLDSAKAANSLNDDSRGRVQLRLLDAIRQALQPLQDEERQTSVAEHMTDVEIHKTLLEGLKDLIEDCGETLVQGWEICFEIIDSIFVQNRPQAQNGEGVTSPQIRLPTRSNRLIRPAFNSLQLICSDFLSSLPNSCFLILVDTLYKFCTQEDDLNIALTTVTFFWVLSDFLSNKNSSLPISNDLMDISEDALVEKASNINDGTSDAALWMLLLLRLTAVTADERIELRNSAIQTLLRILDAYGDKLNPEAWSVCIKSVVFKLFSSIEEELKTVATAKVDDKFRQDWHDTAVVILDGISGLLANYLEVLTVHPTFNSYWQELLTHFEHMLDFHVLEINTATFKALTQILSQCPSGSEKNFNSTTVDLAWQLWSRGIPITDQKSTDTMADNQKCLLSYVAALRDVYRLIEADVTVERVTRMLVLLQEAMQAAVAEAFVSDIDYMTPLQTQVLEILKILRSDIPGVPSVLITQASSFVSLPYRETDCPDKVQAGKKRTFIAMSKSCMMILKDLIVTRTSEVDIYNSGAYFAALTALSRPIVLKYSFAITPKSVQPWREATTTALAILEATLPQIHEMNIPSAKLQDIWDMVIVVTNSVTNAECGLHKGNNSLADDEAFDIESFRRLLALIIPWLGGEVVREKTRQFFAENLFQTSIIHPPAPAERDMIYGGSGNGTAGLANLYQLRPGLTIDPEPSKRSKMGYLCLDELFSLVSHRGEPDNAESYIRLARATAPYTIMRSGLILRAYIADQPLRGRMPQPLSQRKELYHVLRKLIELQSEPEAIPDTPNVDSEKRKHLFRLYPLLSKAHVTAARGGDMTAVELLGKAADVIGDELGLMEPTLSRR